MRFDQFSFRPLKVIEGIAVLLASALASAPAQGAEGIDWCIDGNPDACIVSAFRDGVEIFHHDPVYTIATQSVEIYGTFLSQVSLLPWINNAAWQDPSEESHEWSITVNMRQHLANVVIVHGTEGPIVRSVAPNGDHLLTITSHPITVSASCDGNNVCAEQATDEWRSYLSLEIYEPRWAEWTGMVAADWDGYNIWTNVDRIAVPPFIHKNVLKQYLAGPHFRKDGTTVIEGWISEEIPYNVIRRALYTDDPGTIVAGAVTPTLNNVGRGTVSINLDPVRQIVRLDATGVTFSERVLTIEAASLPPLAGVALKAVRTSIKTKVKVSFAKGTSGGAIISGYQVKCTNRQNGRVIAQKFAKAVAWKRYALVPGVSRTGTWSCSLRVNSTAGYGPWGAPVAVSG